jgi:hypothetical protein
MSTRAPRSGFARRPADPETWVRAAKEQPAGRADGAENTAIAVDDALLNRIPEPHPIFDRFLDPDQLHLGQGRSR